MGLLGELSVPNIGSGFWDAGTTRTNSNQLHVTIWISPLVAIGDMITDDLHVYGRGLLRPCFPFASRAMMMNARIRDGSVV